MISQWLISYHIRLYDIRDYKGSRWPSSTWQVRVRVRVGLSRGLEPGRAVRAGGTAARGPAGRLGFRCFGDKFEYDISGIAKDVPWSVKVGKDALSESATWPGCPQIDSDRAVCIQIQFGILIHPRFADYTLLCSIVAHSGWTGHQLSGSGRVVRC